MPFGNKKRKKRWTMRPVKSAPRSEEVSSSNYYMSKDDHGVNSKKTPPLPMEEGVQARQTTNTSQQEDEIISAENDILFPKAKQHDIRRIAVAYIYRFTLGAPPCSEWETDDGTIEQICRILNLHPVTTRKRRYVKKILCELEHNVKTKMHFNIISPYRFNLGRKTVIKHGSVE